MTFRHYVGDQSLRRNIRPVRGSNQGPSEYLTIALSIELAGRLKTSKYNQRHVSLKTSTIFNKFIFLSKKNPVWILLYAYWRKTYNTKIILTLLDWTLSNFGGPGHRPESIFAVLCPYIYGIIKHEPVIDI